MFQNISEENQEENEYTETKKKIDIKSLFTIKDIILYILSFMVSVVSFNGNLAPFGLAMLAAICSNKFPVAITYIVIAIGSFIGFGLNGLLTFLATSILFIAMIFIFKPKVKNPERNEKVKLGIYCFASTLIIGIVKLFFNDVFLIYDLITVIVLAMLTYIFYKIFVNSLLAIREFREKKAFAIEEIMGASLVLSIAFVSFKGLHIFGLSVTNILSIMLVLFLGWKNGMLVGATAGITIGMVLGIITDGSTILVAAYAISGMIAGILNKLGKIGVILGFCIGNAVLTYFTNGNTVPIITIREILIASLGLLIIPKDIHINISDMFNQTKCLPAVSGVLEGERETADKLNTVSETISQMAKSYNDSANDNLVQEKLKKEARKLFIDEVLNKLEDERENFLYEELIDANEVILEELYDILEEKEEISKEDLLKALEENNNYIIEADDEESQIIKDIMKIVKIINSVYKINKLNLMWKQKEANNKKVLATQLGGVSKVISSIAQDIGTEKAEVEINQNYKLTIGQAKNKKNNSKISGDNSVNIQLPDEKYMIALSDGMGSGESASKASKTVIDMLRKMLTNGFDKEVSIGLINSAVNLNSNSETYATIDISVIDQTNGNVEFIKNGACPTFVKSGNNVEVVKAISFPAGVLNNIDLVVYDKTLNANDIIIMCTDGILDSNEEYENKEIWLKNLIESLETQDVNKIANIILQESIDNGLGIAKDDMTVVVAKIETK